jgi:carbon monoxide dehydrogenase subunit G
VTYLINRDQGKFYQSGATQATQPGLTVFPYLAPPNKKMLQFSYQVEVLAKPEEAWALVEQFDSIWSPLVASIKKTGTGVGQLREIETVDGKIVVERLDSLDTANKTLTYTMVSGIPAKPYTGKIQVVPSGAGCRVSWTVDYRPSGQGELIVRMIIQALVERSLKALQERFGQPK